MTVNSSRAREVFEDVGGLAALEAGVERHEHGADPVDAGAGDDPLGAVRRPHGDPVARLDAGGDQGPPGLVGRGQQLRERQAEVALDQGLHVGEEPGGALERSGDGRGQVSGDGDLVGHGRQDCIPGRGPSPAAAPPTPRPAETSAYMIQLPCRGPRGRHADRRPTRSAPSGENEPVAADVWVSNGGNTTVLAAPAGPARERPHRRVPRRQRREGLRRRRLRHRLPGRQRPDRRRRAAR